MACLRHNPAMRLRMLLTLIVIVFASWGCQPQERVGGKPNPVKINSFVSLSPSATEVVPGILFSPLLKGRTESCDYPAYVTRAPVVMKGVKPNYDMIASIKPDLVLYDPSLFSEEDIAKLEQMKLRTMPIGGDTLEDYYKSLYRVAALLNGEIVIQEYIDKIRAARGVALASATEPKQKVAIMISGDRGDHMIAGTKSFVADAVRAAGGDVVGPDSNKFETLSVESLLGWAPNVVFVSGKAESILDDPRLKSLPAVQKKTVASVNSSVLLRRGGRVDKLIESLGRFLRAPQPYVRSSQP